MVLLINTYLKLLQLLLRKERCLEQVIAFSGVRRFPTSFAVWLGDSRKSTVRQGRHCRCSIRHDRRVIRVGRAPGGQSLKLCCMLMGCQRGHLEYQIMQNNLPALKVTEDPSSETMGAIRNGDGKWSGPSLDLAIFRLDLPPQHQMPLPGKRKRPENAEPSEHMKKKNFILVSMLDFARCWCQGEGVGCGVILACSTQYGHARKEERRRKEG